MEWTQVFVILGACSGGFLWLAYLIRENGKSIHRNREEILEKKLSEEIQQIAGVTKEFLGKEEEPKEN